MVCLAKLLLVDDELILRPLSVRLWLKKHVGVGPGVIGRGCSTAGRPPGARSARGPGSTKSAPRRAVWGVHPDTSSHGQTQAPIVVSDRAFQPKEPGFLGLMAGSRAGQGEHRMSPEHP